MVFTIWIVISCMKVLIPVTGSGTHLRPLTYTQPTALIRVAGKPILSHLIDSLTANGFTEFILVVGYLGEKIRDYVRETYPTLRVEFIEQDAREGIGHAVWLAHKFYKNETELYLVIGDSIFDTDLKVFINSTTNCVGVREVKDPRVFGIVELDANGVIKKVEDKPRIPHSNIALVGLYKFVDVSLLFDALQKLIKENRRAHNEIHLTDAIQNMVENGVSISAITINNWYDCSRTDILLKTNALMLAQKGMYAVDLPPFDNTIFVHPISIGENCIINDSIIGPYVSIGNNAVINSSIVKNSIVGDYSALTDVVITQSVIGSDASVKGANRVLNIGDNTQIEFT